MGSDVIGLDRTLASAGVFDGDVVSVRESAIVSVPTLFDDVRVAATDSALSRWLTTHWIALTGFTLAFAAAVVWSWRFPQTGLGIVAAALTLVAGIICAVVGCVESFRTRAVFLPTALSVLSVPLLFTGSWCIVPDGFTMPSLPLAFATVALAAQLVLQISRSGHVFHSFVIALCVLGGVTAVAVNLWHPPARTLGALVATVAVVVLYLAPASPSCSHDFRYRGCSPQANRSTTSKPMAAHPWTARMRSVFRSSPPKRISLPPGPAGQRVPGPEPWPASP